MTMDLTLFLLFLKIGITCFGGGYGMMSMILDEGAKRVGVTVDDQRLQQQLDIFIQRHEFFLAFRMHRSDIRAGGLASSAAWTHLRCAKKAGSMRQMYWRLDRFGKT